MRSNHLALALLPLVSVLDCGGKATQISPDGQCDLLKPFAAPVPLSGLAVPSGAPEWHPSLSPDELTIYFNLDQGFGHGSFAYQRVYVAQRPTRDVSFSNPQPLAGLTIPGGLQPDEGEDPTVSSDGLTIYFTHKPEPLRPEWQIYSATRNRADDAFSNPLPILRPGVGQVDAAFLSADSQTLYLDFDTGSGIAMTRKRWSGADWQNDGPVISEADDRNCNPTGCRPVVSSDGRTLFFLRVRASASAPNPSDIWSANRATASGPFGSPALVRELAGLSYAEPGWLSAYGCRLYLTMYSQDHPDDSIYVAARGR